VAGMMSRARTFQEQCHFMHMAKAMGRAVLASGELGRGRAVTDQPDVLGVEDELLEPTDRFVLAAPTRLADRPGRR
jgi:hypothetical protein